MKAKLRELIEQLRREQVVEKIQNSKSNEEALEIYQKIKCQNEEMIRVFKRKFDELSLEIGLRENIDMIEDRVQNVIAMTVRPKDAVIICVICHMTSIADDELLDYVVLKRALKCRAYILKAKDSNIARRLLKFMYNKKEEKFLDELTDDEFVELFIS